MNKPNVGDILVGRYSYNSVIYTFYKVQKVTDNTVTMAEVRKYGYGCYNGGQYFVGPTHEIIGKAFVKRLPRDKDYIKKSYEYIRPWNGSEMVEAHGMD